VKDFKGAAQILEKGGYTQFTPHYITWYCPQAFTISKQCKSQCINHGRYCAPDPEQDFSSGYEGKDVVIENLRQLCVFKVANESSKSWLWWDYVTDFQIRCPMKEKKYNKECADAVMKSLGLDSKKIEKCMGDPNADADNPVLKEEQDAQVGKGSRGDVTILPTLVVNNRQYRGKLAKGAVLKAICSGFEETTEPACYVELPRENRVNLCGGMFTPAEITDGWALRVPQPALADMLRRMNAWITMVAVGKIKQPISQLARIHFEGESVNVPWLMVCSSKEMDIVTVKLVALEGAILTMEVVGINHKTDTRTLLVWILEMLNAGALPGLEVMVSTIVKILMNAKRRKPASALNVAAKTPGEAMSALAVEIFCKSGTEVKSAWAAVWVILIGLAMASGGAYLVYKYRLRSYMDSEIRAIMAQYMPLDSQSEVPNHVSEDRA
ncbi:hypothetical protein Goari_000392, partial [Gossypium aridum]|nr:hypothetical protein [Gossypium aridum]